MKLGNIPATNVRWAKNIYDAQKIIDEGGGQQVSLPEDDYVIVDRQGREMLLAVLLDTGELSDKHLYLVSEYDVDHPSRMGPGYREFGL